MNIFIFVPVTGNTNVDASRPCGGGVCETAQHTLQDQRVLVMSSLSHACFLTSLKMWAVTVGCVRLWVSRRKGTFKARQAAFPPKKPVQNKQACLMFTRDGSHPVASIYPRRAKGAHSMNADSNGCV